MIRQYRGGEVPEGSGGPIAALASKTILDVTAAFDAFEFSRGMEAVWGLMSAARINSLWSERPGCSQVARTRKRHVCVNDTLYTAAEALRIAAALLSPVLPQSAPKIWAQLGMTEPLEAARLDTLAWGQLPPGQRIGEIAALFPRIELKDAVAKMSELEELVTAEQNVLLGKKPEPVAPEPRHPGRR